MTRRRISTGLAHRLALNEDGVTAVVVALCLTTVMGFAGLAIDVGLWYSDKRTAQGAADSAAYSAAVDLATADTASNVVATAKAIAAQYGFTDGTGGVTVTVNSPPTSGPNTATVGAVEVIVTKPETLFFSSLFLRSAQISARAVATAGATTSKYCVESLDPSAFVTTVNLNNAAAIDVSQCGLYVDGSGPMALSVSSGAALMAKTVAVVGGYLTIFGTINSPSIITSAPLMGDPYAGVAVPTPGACTGPPTYASYDSSNGYTGHYVISPGTYCSGFSAFNGVTVTMNPGVYIIKGGVFSVQGGATLLATGGVTIVLTGSGLNYATANLSSGITVNLTAPTTGSTAGLAIMQDRNAPHGVWNYVAGGANLNVTGAIYFPSQNVSLSSGASNNSNCTQLIAYDLAFTGGFRFANVCGGTGVVGIGAGGVTNLVE